MTQQQQHCTPSSFSGYQNNFNTSYSQVPRLETSEYPGSSFYVSTMVNNKHTSPSTSYYYDQTYQYAQQAHGSPDSSFMSTSPSSGNHVNKLGTCSPSSIMIQEPPMLIASSSSTTTASTMSSTSVEFLNEAFAKATSLPESFYPEFLQYSKETYEQSTGQGGNGGGPNRKKQKRFLQTLENKNGEDDKAYQQQQNEQDESENDEDMNNSNLTSTELRRQIHIQSEQKRRAQIKDGFEELRNELPTCLNKKMSKVALLHRTVQHIQHLKDTQTSILSELERLVHENEQLRKFQEGILQKQALESMYTMTNM